MPKAQSVDRSGSPDGFEPAGSFHAEVLEGGVTRIVVSVSPERLQEVHLALLGLLRPPLRVLYVQLTDRATGQLASPKRFVGVELAPQRVVEALRCNRELVWHDGRHQLWVKEQGPAQVVLEEIGVLYAYPDDPATRDCLRALGLEEARTQTMAERDYVKVEFIAAADAQQASLVQELELRPWDR